MVQDAAVREDSAAVAAPADSEEEAVRAEAAAVPAEAEPAGDKRTKENAAFPEESLANGTVEFAYSELRKKLCFFLRIKLSKTWRFALC